MEQLREKFLRIYSNMPLKLRDDIILVFKDKKPITWRVAYLEIKNNTDWGKKLLKELKELDFI